MVGGAFFYACRSCEYSKVDGDRKTNCITLGNIRFFVGTRELHQDDPDLDKADSVQITFTLQKNNIKYESITQFRTDDNDGLCPVARWARLVRRMRSHPGCNDTTPVYKCYDYERKQWVKVTAKMITTALRIAAIRIGERNLGFKAVDLGTHSIRSGAAMAMYLTDTPVYTIMLIGRWSSDAFLHYIRTQVQGFARGVSRRMVMAEDFFHTPDHFSLEDPRTSNHRNNFAGRGLVSGRSDATRPSFSLHH